MTADATSAIFKALRSIGAGAADFQTRDAGIDLGAGEVRHAIDAESRPALLVPLTSEEDTVEDLASRGISLRTFLMEGRPVLIVRCEDAVLESQFALIVDDMIRSLTAGPTNSAAACLAVMNRWRSLLEPSTDGLLGVGAQIGLLAELHLLEQSARISPSAALEAWTGPDSSRHDFSTARSSVEVKATLNRDQFLVGIHGDRQLDLPVKGVLYLYAEQVEATPAGESLNDVVGRLFALDLDRTRLLKKLASVHFRMTDRAAYEDYKFAIVRTKLAVVDQDFPKVTRSEMADPRVLDAIQSLTYSVDIGPIRPFCPDEVAIARAAELVTEE